ncbi:NUDIX domain-containing protein [Sporichthya polymorpha]|uniref:NUDIX domain-containing protein n=1 Tax=Sporichthya polymorpha TaxID=35751 RepID=UPI00037A10DA|nr:NUDIX hydrolase [Sporichthya polymorpha]
MSSSGAPLADTDDAWKVFDSTTAFTGGVVSMRVDEVAMPGSLVAKRDVLVHPGSVGILVLDDSEDTPKVLMLRQYRHPIQRRLWEFPAGLLDENESALAAAKRELEEETHLQARDWRVLLDAYTSPGISDEAVRIYLARDVRPSDGDRRAAVHEEADMELRWVPLPDVVSGVLGGRLHNPLVVMGSLALQNVLTTDGTGSLRPATAPWRDRPA